MSLPELQKLIAEHIAKKLWSLPSQVISEIYAISLFVECQESQIIFSVNTTQQVKLAIKGKSCGYGLPQNEAEAKWNYAFWMQKPSSRFLTPPESADGELWIQLLKERGIIYIESDDFDPDSYEIAIRRILNEVAIKVSRFLHASGVICDVFGRNIPIIVHELEYCEDHADNTEAANPPGVAREFVTWVMKRSLTRR